MVFSSLSFIFFLLPLFLLVDNIAINNTKTRNVFLIIFSLLFYIWGEAYNIFILIFLGVINYIGGIVVFRANIPVRKIFLWIFIFIDVGCLIYYKYIFWFFSQLVLIIPTLSHFTITPQVLPLGISFFTFHGISYIIDIYRKDIKEEPSSINFLTYFFMFPHLVAGPIVRFAQIKNDLNIRSKNWNLFVYGVARFILGINKKVIIANSVAPIADGAFSLPIAQLSMADTLIGAIAYTVQIYFDFSGYSDMAIGLAAMVGIHFEENFKKPYCSTSIKEFWRCWHISLSTWFRDYIYIPLGGSKCSAFVTYRNLFLVFIICGLWHGAHFTFLFWGFLHGILLIIERLGLEQWLQKRAIIIRRFYCMTMVIIGWIFFRSESIERGMHFLKNIFYPSHGLIEINIPIGPLNIAALVMGIFISLFPLKLFSSNSSHNPQYAPLPYIFNILCFLFSISILYIGARNPFIYFNF